MKSRVVASVLAVVGAFALSATGAQAGGGFGGSGVTGFFVCHGINGGDQGQVVDIQSDELGTDPIRDVRIGSGVLGCTGVTVTDPATALEITPGTGTYMKCYTISVPRRPIAAPAGTPTLYAAIDSFEPDPGETVIASAIRYLCGTANFIPQ